jgi:hypothetical protein
MIGKSHSLAMWPTIPQLLHFVVMPSRKYRLLPLLRRRLSSKVLSFTRIFRPIHSFSRSKSHTVAATTSSAGCSSDASRVLAFPLDVLVFLLTGMSLAVIEACPNAFPSPNCTDSARTPLSAQNSMTSCSVTSYTKLNNRIVAVVGAASSDETMFPNNCLLLSTSCTSSAIISRCGCGLD